MGNLKIKIVNKASEVLREREGSIEAQLFYDKAYEEGDKIIIETSEKNSHLVIQVDDALGPAQVYLTEHTFTYAIPFGEKRYNLSPKVFSGMQHLLWVRKAREKEITNYRNLAVNVIDQHGTTNCYPHASANVETRGEAVFAAKNAIDGVTANWSHGQWPYTSWGINQQDDAAFCLEFGRNVAVDEVVLYTRADFPHDNWWQQVKLSFSDGSEMIWDMEKSALPHNLKFSVKKIEWIRLSELIKADDPSPFPALSQIRVYGKDILE